MHALLRFLVRDGLVADWRDFLFLHFALPADVIAPHLPLPPELFEGRAYVSLVSFRLERLRPARGLPPRLGRLLFRPASDHAFLNLRAYVHGPAGPGILFLAEWINNPLSARLGPAAYGLPYRLARMSRVALPGAGLQRVSVSDDRTGASSSFVVPRAADTPPGPAAGGSLDAFLLERYLAYTHREGTLRHFAVTHPPWQASPFHLARFHAPAIEGEFGWFGRADFVSGHLARGFEDVAMGPPIVATGEKARAAQRAWTTAEDGREPQAASACMPR